MFNCMEVSATTDLPLTNSTERSSPYWGTNNYLGSKEIPRFFFWSPRVHYRVPKNPPMESVLSQLDPVHFSPPISLTSVLILCFIPGPSLSSGFILTGFPTKMLCTFQMSPIRATCRAHLIVLDFIILIVEIIYVYNLYSGDNTDI
jgi:hypothetical protein